MNWKNFIGQSIPSLSPENRDGTIKRKGYAKFKIGDFGLICQAGVPLRPGCSAIRRNCCFIKHEETYHEM
jgi:hypothetical protein